MDFDDVVQLAADLVGIPSVSGGEGALADLIEAELSRFDHLRVLRDGDAVVARTDLGRPSRILLAGHIDTVPVAGNVPGELREDGTLWGRGSVDMKAGDAVFLHLAARLSHPRTDLTWVFYDHEEVEASLNGLGRLASRHPDWLEADLAVLGEPTDGGIEGGCNGTMRFSLTARGVAAHSARPWMGENAIHALLPALETLAAWQPQTRAVDGLDYTESLLAVAIGGGRAGNSVPDEARLVVNFRFAPDRSPDEAEAYVRSLFPGYEFDVQDMAPGARPGPPPSSAGPTWLVSPICRSPRSTAAPATPSSPTATTRRAPPTRSSAWPASSSAGSARACTTLSGPARSAVPD